MNRQVVDVPGYEGLYKVDSCGNVISMKRKGTRGVILKGRPDKGGYLSVILHKNGKAKNWLVHRLVALAFLGAQKPGLEVNHKDRDRKNNRVSNLEWVTNKENILHACSGPLWHRKSVDMFDRLGNYLRSFPSIADAAKTFENGNSSNISQCAQGKRATACGYIWRYSDDEERGAFNE